MFSPQIILVLLSSFLTVNGEINPGLSACKLNDNKCLNNLILHMAEEILDGVPSLGIESSDPMYFDRIDGSIPLINFTLINSTITGYKKCKFNSIDIDVSQSKMDVKLSCPRGCYLVGDYEVNGEVFNELVDGKGDFQFLLGAFDVNVYAQIELKETIDGKGYIRVKDFSTDAKITSPFKARFNNLFNGNKAMSDAVHQIAHENWELFADLFQGPLLSNSFTKILRSFNKYSKTVHLDNKS